MNAQNTAASASTLQLRDLRCTLGTRLVLRGLSLDALQGGQIVAILGRNGAGKSTLLRCLAGLLPCEAGTLRLGATDLRPLKAAQRSHLLRYLPQAAPGSLHLSVRDCLLVALRAQGGRPDGDAQLHIAATAADLGLDNLLDRYVEELSGGQRQLVWLAQALIHQPRALLLDEPLAALDPNHQHHVMRLLRRLAAERELIVLVVLHDLNMAVRYADQVVVLREGQALAQGPVADALTPRILAQAFQVDARVERCSQGTPFILIDDLLSL